MIELSQRPGRLSQRPIAPVRPLGVGQRHVLVVLRLGDAGEVRQVCGDGVAVLDRLIQRQRRLIPPPRLFQPARLLRDEPQVHEIGGLAVRITERLIDRQGGLK